MKFFFYLCLLALVAFATGMPLSSPLNVTLTSTGTSNMQVTIQNVGMSDVALVTAGSLFDPHPVQKVTMHSGSTALAFRGTIVDPKSITALVSTDFTKLHAGQSSSVQFDAADMYDLSSGGTFTAEAAGYIWDAESFGFISYKSNPLKITLGEVETAMVERRDKPSEEEGHKIDHSTCSGGQKELIEQALGGCSLYADAGAHATWNKTANHFFLRYFKSTKEADLDLVHDRLIAISNECLEFDGKVLIACADRSNSACKIGNMGYTTVFPSGVGIITLCPRAFDSEIYDSESCHSMDIAGFLMAEHALFKCVFDPPTSNDNEDYETLLGMSSKKALDNAGSYRLLGKAAYFDCKS